MVQLKEQIDVSSDVPSGHLYYNVNLVQEQFKLPYREKDFRGNFFSFLYESILLSYFCFRSKRFKQIATAIFKLVKQARKNKVEIPSLLLNVFVELGSTFIKIGQFLSSRGDLFPKEYIEALSQLQDSVLPLPFENIKLQLEKELRKPLDKIFKSFNSEPIASASIGQVHKALLLNGLEVVVKVQRPDLSVLFYRDLAILRCLATFLERYTEIGEDREWVQMVDEIGKTLFEEIDFVQEGRNADHFRKNLKYEERIYIPKVFWQYTTRKLITIEFAPGIKITDIEALKQNNLNPKELALVLANAYFKQFFEDGFYHADPHPGNIVVKKDGTIVFYDFGMVGRINESVREELLKVLVSIIGNDTDTLLSTLKKLELIKSQADINPIKRVIEQAAYQYYDGAKLENLDLNGVAEDLKKLFNDKPMKLPSKFTYTLRMTGALEGVCRTLDPDFSLVQAATPYVQNWVTERSPGTKWSYLKTIFPTQSKLLDKIKIYLEVIKDLPKYISSVEQNKKNVAEITKNIPDKNHKIEIKEISLKLNLAYSVIFLLCFVVIGSFLLERGNNVISILGLLLLIGSLIGSIGMVSWIVFNKKVIE